MEQPILNTTIQENPSIRKPRHKHEFIESGNLLVCSTCQYSKLKFNNGIAIRSNGMKYTMKKANERKVFFYPDKWMQFYSLLSSKNRIMFDILINTGARINEARHISLHDIGQDRNTLNIRITKVRAREGEKSPTGRLIPISSQFKNLLLTYAKNNPLEEVDCKECGGKVKHFPMQSTAGIWKLLRVNCAKIGMEGYNAVSAHNIRKTFENWLIALGIEPFKVASHLGHTLNVASKNYTSPDVFKPNDKILIRRILGDLYLN